MMKKIFLCMLMLMLILTVSFTFKNDLVQEREKPLK